MGAGIAYFLAQKYPGLEQAYKDYIEDFKENNGKHWKKLILGTVFYYQVDADLCIANCFSQFSHELHETLTSYDSIIKCFENVRDIVGDDAPVYIPFQYGSGIAGGNWLICQEIAKDFDMTIVARTSDYEKWLNK